MVVVFFFLWGGGGRAFNVRRPFFFTRPCFARSLKDYRLLRTAGPPRPQAVTDMHSLLSFFFVQEYVSLKAYDLVASSKGELERTRR